jgi:hypothetical protein
MSNEIAKIENLPINTIADLREVGDMLQKSCMFGVQNIEEGFVVATTCHQEKMSLMQFMRTYHIIENKPSMKASVKLAKFRERGGKFKILQRDRLGSKALFTFEGEEYEFSYTVEDAKLEEVCFKKGSKVLKDNWRKNPKQMCWARLGSGTVDLLCPEIGGGVYSPEEIQDFDKPESSPKVEKVIDVKNINAVLDKKEPIKDKPKPVEKVIDITDYTVSPLSGAKGNMIGVKWATVNTKNLKLLLEKCKDPLFEDGHRQIINDIIESRNGK